MKDWFGLLLIFGYFYLNIPYSNGQMCTDEKEVVGIMPLGMLPLQVRDLLQAKMLCTDMQNSPSPSKIVEG